MSPDATAPPDLTGSPSPFPRGVGILLGIFSFGLALLTWPGLLQRWFSLQWQMGNMRIFFYGLSILGSGLALLSFWFQRKIDSLLARAFPTPKRLGFALLAVAVSLGLSLVATEILFRAIDFPLRTTWVPSENALARFDPELGWAYRPNFSSTQLFGNPPQRIDMHFNEMGLRVPEPGYRLDPEAPSVLFAGCSYTMGHGVAYPDTFASRFEIESGGRFQAVNLGVQAYGTDQAFLLLKRHFDEFNTKAVVYTFLLDHVKRNDNHDRRLLFPKARFLGTKPRFDLDTDGSLHLIRTPQKFEEMTRCRVCELVQLFWTRSGPPPRMALTQALVREMRDYVESRGAVFLLVLWTQPHKMPTPELVASLFPGMDPEKVVDVGFDAPPGWGRWIIPGGYHPDARAHARLGKLLSEKFSELGLE